MYVMEREEGRKRGGERQRLEQKKYGQHVKAYFVYHITMAYLCLLHMEAAAISPQVFLLKYRIVLATLH